MKQNVKRVQSASYCFSRYELFAVIVTIKILKIQSSLYFFRGYIEEKSYNAHLQRIDRMVASTD